MKTMTRLGSLFSGVLFLFAGNSLFLSSAGVKLSQMGVDNLLIGLLNASFFSGAALSAVLAHRIISRIGHIRSFGVFGAVFAIGALAHGMTQSLWLWGLLRLLLGFCYYSLLMVAESWLSERSEHHNRSRILSYYNIVYYAAFSLGILLLGLGLNADRIFTLSAMLVMAAMVPIGMTRLPEPSLPPRQRISIPRVFDIVPLALVSSLLAGLMVNGFFTMASVFILQQGLAVKQVSYFLFAAMLGGFLIQWPIAKISDSTGRRNAIVVSATLALVATAVAAASAYFLPGQVWWQYAAAALFGSGVFTLYSLSLAQANDELPNHLNTVEVSRSLLFCYGIGSLSGPIVIGLMMRYIGNWGFNLTFLACAAVLLAYALKQPKLPKEALSVYVGMPGSAGAIMPELDPRNEADEPLLSEEDIDTILKPAETDAPEPDVDQPDVNTPATPHQRENE